MSTTAIRTAVLATIAGAALALTGALPASAADVVPPGAPTGLSATATTTSLAVTWTAPAEVGAGLVGWYVSIAPAGSGTWTLVSGTYVPQLLLTGLAPATSYDVGVVTVATDGQQSEQAVLTATTLAVLTPHASATVVRYGASAVVKVRDTEPGAVVSADSLGANVATVSIVGTAVTVVPRAGFVGWIAQPVTVTEASGTYTVVLKVKVNKPVVHKKPAHPTKKAAHARAYGRIG